MGAYAVRLIFDDGHRTGDWSWAKLYEPGEVYNEEWAIYQKHFSPAFA